MHSPTMLSILLRRARFTLERWIQQGVLHQLLLVVALVVGVAVLGGLAAWLATSQFQGPGEAIWWSFLRLTDPGYLGDDEGLVLRIVSTAVTVIGYVLFMGTLIAIMTQWLSRTMRQLESGLTPIAMLDHVVILGWTNRTPEIVRQLVSARGRLRRFLERTEVNRLRVVVQAQEVSAEVRLALREHLGDLWNHNQVFLRLGSPLDLDDLQRLDLTRAAAVIVPGADFSTGGADTSDTRVVKALLTLASLLRDVELEERPAVVAEIFDPLKAPLARNAFEGAVEVISSDRTISRVLSQSLRHRDLANVLFGLVSNRRGNTIYLRTVDELAGHPPAALHASFPRAVVLGVLRATPGGDTHADLDPRSDVPVGVGEPLVLLAQQFDDTVPQPAAAGTRPAESPPVVFSGTERDQRILVLGWSHKLAALAIELGEDTDRRFELTIMSRVPIAERDSWFERVDFDRERVRVLQIEGDYALESDLREVDLEYFDHAALVASDWLPSSEESDARTVLGYVLLRAKLRALERPPKVLVELLDPDNAQLFDDERDEYLVTPQVLSYLLAHVALRPELNEAYEALLSTGGAEIDLCTADALGLADRPVTFAEVQQRVFEAGMTALGYLTAAGVSELNPDRRAARSLAAEDRVIVLTTDR